MLDLILEKIFAKYSFIVIFASLFMSLTLTAFIHMQYAPMTQGDVVFIFFMNFLLTLITFGYVVKKIQDKKLTNEES